jgi:hypothetical protein
LTAHTLETRRWKAGSQSAVLDELLQGKKREEQRASLETNVAAYYDSLSDEERREEQAWGELAEQSLVLKEEEAFYEQPTARRNLVHAVADRKRKAPGGHRVGQRAKQSSAR